MLCPFCRVEVASTSLCPECGTPIGDDDATVVRAPSQTRPRPRTAEDDEDATLLARDQGPRSSADDDATLLTSTPPAADTGPLTPGQEFGRRYRIIKLLGLGGMGAVYQTWDQELELVVALKIIRPEAAEDPEMEAELEARFKRELLLAREVTHKNVVRIHDLGEIDGIKYITMSYIDGQELQSFMREKGRLEVAEALRILRSIATGLGAAHDAGVVHRDLKPANIMLDSRSGEGVIMDFGIARSATTDEQRKIEGARVGRADFSRANLGHTQSGMIVGTIAYMPPEQARGEQADWRSDIYSLGLIFYDMLVGEPRAARADSALSELNQRCTTAPPPVRSFVPDLPEALDRLISRCLAPNPDDRFENPGDLRAELDRLDDQGHPLPVVRRLTSRLGAGAAVVVVGLIGVTWWISGSRAPGPEPDPISVLVADIANGTGDTAFDGTLEPMLMRGLDEAGFITTYDRRRLPALGVQRTDGLDDVAAREVAVQQGLGVVLAGSIDPRGNGYELSLVATRPVTGEVISRVDGRARSKDQVLGVATRLTSRIRKALGDDTSESAQQFAMASLSATSLDVVGLYAAAMEASSDNRFEEARQSAARAVELDPDFGLGYLILAVNSGNLGNSADQKRYLGEALRHLDGMTERERYTTRGYSYWVSGDYEQCVKEYGALIALYPADVAGRNQLALCLSNLREMRRAMEEVQEIVKILPSHPLFRDNLALYANYASDFLTAEETARSVQGPDAYATLALALSQLGQGRISAARQTYESLTELGAAGASLAASGLGDLAAFEGRYTDAVEILTSGAAADLEAENSRSAAAKLAAAAYAELSRGDLDRAVAAADEALRHSDATKIRFLAARTFIEAGDTDRARPLIGSLAGELYAEPRAYAKILDGLIAGVAGETGEALMLLREANDLFDTWIGAFELGRASLAAGLHTQADGAFDVCLNARRGEALSLFVDEEPTFAYLPRAHYYQGRAREEIGTAGYRDSYNRYLEIRGASTEDPLVEEVRKRIAG